MNTSFGPRSHFVQSPSADGSTTPIVLGLDQVTALRRETQIVQVVDRSVAVEVYAGVYDPDAATLAARLPDGSRHLGTVRQRLYLGTAAGRARVLDCDSPLFETPPGDDGQPGYVALLPEGVDPETRLHADLVAEIKRDLAAKSLLALRRQTLAPRSALEAIARGLPEENWWALEADAVEVVYLAIDTVHLSKRIGDQRRALHVVACDPRCGLYFTLALIDWKQGRDHVIARLAEVFTRLPRPALLRATVTDYGDEERDVVEAALAEARKDCPQLAPLAVLDRFHIQKAFADAMGRLRVKAWKAEVRGKNGRRLKNVSQAAKARAKAIKAAAKALEKMRQRDLEARPASKALLEAAFKAAPELAAAYGILEGLRRLLECRSVAAAEARYAAWREKLAKSGLDGFDGAAQNLAGEWQAVRTYFRLLEQLDAAYGGDLKVSSTPAESLNKAAKALWREARCSTIERLEQRLIARQGYLVKAAALAAPTRPPRRRRKKDSGKGETAGKSD